MEAAAFQPQRMSRVEVFQKACERNALRRAGGLPLVPIRASCEQIMRADAARIYVEAVNHYHSEYLAIRATVTKELREKKGADFGVSAGGRWVIDYMARGRFEAHLRELGFGRPDPQVIRYGSNSSS